MGKEEREKEGGTEKEAERKVYIELTKYYLKLLFFIICTYRIVEIVVMLTAK